MIQNKIHAGYPSLYLVTHEEQGAEAMILATIQELRDTFGHEWKLWAWTCTAGRFSADGTETFDEDPLAILDAVTGMEEKSIFIPRGLPPVSHIGRREYPLPIIFRKFKDTLFDLHDTEPELPDLILNDGKPWPSSCPWTTDPASPSQGRVTLA